MRRNLILASVLALTIPGALLAQRDRSDRERSRSRRSSDDDRDWMDNCRNSDWGDRDRVRFCEERTMGWRAQAGQALSVDASPNGGVSVTGWDKDSVHVVLRIQTNAGTDAEARELAASLRVVNENGRLHVDGPSSRRWASWSVSFEIFAPRRVDLDLSTVNGPLEIEDVTGRLRLEAQNGPLALDNVAGDVRARAQNGPLHVVLSGTHWEGVGLDAETQNGPLELVVPDGYNAQLETGTINGPLDIGFPITVQGRIGMGSRRRIQTTLGTGGTLVRAVTTNGPATLRRS
jgi:DUF4097 and DUF4098 domain-containing protein YvlB